MGIFRYSKENCAQFNVEFKSETQSRGQIIFYKFHLPTSFFPLHLRSFLSVNCNFSVPTAIAKHLRNVRCAGARHIARHSVKEKTGLDIRSNALEELPKQLCLSSRVVRMRTPCPQTLSSSNSSNEKSMTHYATVHNSQF